MISAPVLGSRRDTDDDEFIDIVTSSAPSVGYCNIMGAATTMNPLVEVLGMHLPSSAAILAPHRERGQISYETGQRVVYMVWEDLRPIDIKPPDVFENAILINSPIGGSTNTPIHLNAIAQHLGVHLENNDCQAIGYNVPLLVNLQLVGEFL